MTKIKRCVYSRPDIIKVREQVGHRLVTTPRRWHLVVKLSGPARSAELMP